MPYTYDSPPAFVKNKPKNLQKIAVDVFNKALQSGRSEEEALFAAIAAVKAQEKPKRSVNKDFRTRPSHFPVRDIEKAQEGFVQPLEASTGTFASTTKVIPIRREFLGDNALPTEQERNVVSADFDDKNRLVITFDTGERIITRAIAIEEHLENYVSLVNKGSSTGASGLVKYETNLAGLSQSIPSGVHGITELVSIYFTKNSKEISVDWLFDNLQNIVINSNVDLTGVVLVAYGN